MFLLLLMGLGAASVKAQVRIGGNGAPNAAAVLDLNTTDATNNGTKGLALPRVSLTSNTMQLTSGVANLTGMLVYNTTATLGQIGIYYWDGSRWGLASLPPATTADSGKYLEFNGLTPTWRFLTTPAMNGAPLRINRSVQNITWTLILDTTFLQDFMPNTAIQRSVPGLATSDLCYHGGGYISALSPGYDVLWIMRVDQGIGGTGSFHVRCYRPSA